MKTCCHVMGGSWLVYQVYDCATARYSCWVLALLGAGEVIRRTGRRIVFVTAEDDMASCFLVPVQLGVRAEAMMWLTAILLALHPMLC